MSARPHPRWPRAAAAALLAALAASACGGGSGKSGPPACAPASGTICTVAGTGVEGDGADDMPALATNLYLPQDVTVTPDGRVFIVDWNNHKIRQLRPDGTLHVVAGEGELGATSDDPSALRMNHPTNVVLDPAGHLIIAAWHNSRIEMLDFTTGALTDLYGTGDRGFAGDGGPAATAVLNLPVGVAYDAQGDLIISDQANDRLRRVDATTRIITTIAGTGPCDAGPGMCPLGDGGPASEATFWFPEGQAAQPGGRIDIDVAGNLYISDVSDHLVRKIDAATGIISTIAGTRDPNAAPGGTVATETPVGIINDVAVAPDGSVFFVDTSSSCVRVARPDGSLATAVGTCGQSGFAGDGDAPTAALLDRPTGIALDAMGAIYVADQHNQRIRLVMP
jgi:sugar lactone lactonase YvrE